MTTRDAADRPTHPRPAADAGGMRVPRAVAAVRRAAAVSVAAGALVAATGCTAPEPRAPTAHPATTISPDGIGHLRPGMAEAQALATGDLRSTPAATVTGCRVYSFRDGPVPDPQRIARDAEIENRADQAAARAEQAHAEAQAAAHDPGRLAPLETAAAAANVAAAETALAATERRAQVRREFTAAGGVSFDEGTLRLIVAPPAVRTAAGIGRGSTVTALKAAYGAQGLADVGDDRFEVPVGGDGWVLAFEMHADRVAAIQLVDPATPCR